MRRAQRAMAPAALILLLAIVLAMAWVPAAGAASYRKLYVSGRDAVVARDWQETFRLMREAIREEPLAKSQIRGNIPYIPYYYLGLALYEMNDCTGALRAWEESERQGVVKQFEQYQVLVDGRSDCLDLSRRGELLEKLREKLVESEGVYRTVERARQEATRPDAPDDGLSGRWAEATRALGAASELAAEGRRLPEAGDLEEALRSVAQVDSSLVAMGDEVERVGKVVADQMSEASRSLYDLRQATERSLAQTAFLEPFPPVLAAARTELRRQLVQASQDDSGTDLDALGAIASELRSSLRSYEALAAMPPRWLQKAVEAYMKGRYEEALDLLDESSATSDRVRAHLRLLRAAVSFALEVKSGGRTEHAFTAQQDIVALVESGASLEPTRGFFSEAFVEYWQETSDRARASDAEDR